MVKIFSSSLKKYVDWSDLPIIKAIEKIEKGELYEKKKDESESFKQIILKNRKTNKF